jgi:hypothetical protein
LAQPSETERERPDYGANCELFCNKEKGAVNSTSSFSLFKAFSLFSTIDFTAFYVITISSFIKKIMASKNFSTF